VTKYRSSSSPGLTVVIGLLFVPLFLPAARAQAPQPQPPSAAAPSLPAEEPPIGPLRRGPNGEIELVTPESERAQGRALCDPNALCVGEGQTYATLRQALAQAKDGDAIEVIGGTYKEAVTVAVPRLTLRGTAGRPHFDCAGLDLGNGRACIDVAAAGVKLDNLEVSGAGGDGACVRQTGGADLDLEEIYCHDSAYGVDAGRGTIEIIHSEFYDNAQGNADFGACDMLRVSGSVFRDAHAGAEFVSNCRRTDILDTRFVDSQSGRALDFPTGGNAMVFRSFIEKIETASSDDIAVFTSKSCAHPGTLALKEVRILNSRRNAVIRNGNLCPEGAVTLEDVTVEGVQVGTQGFINDLGGNALGGGPVQ
jgi:hypothetical protein